MDTKTSDSKTTILLSGLVAATIIGSTVAAGVISSSAEEFSAGLYATLFASSAALFAAIGLALRTRQEHAAYRGAASVEFVAAAAYGTAATAILVYGILGYSNPSQLNYPSILFVALLLAGHRLAPSAFSAAIVLLFGLPSLLSNLSMQGFLYGGEYNNDLMLISGGYILIGAVALVLGYAHRTRFPRTVFVAGTLNALSGVGLFASTLPFENTAVGVCGVLVAVAALMTVVGWVFRQAVAAVTAGSIGFVSVAFLLFGVAEFTTAALAILGITVVIAIVAAFLLRDKANEDSTSTLPEGAVEVSSGLQQLSD